MIKCLLFLPIFAIGQVEFYGYMEAEYDYLQFSQSNYNFGYNKLCLELESRSSDNVVIGSGGSARAVIFSLINNAANNIYILSLRWSPRHFFCLSLKSLKP